MKQAYRSAIGSWSEEKSAVAGGMKAKKETDQ
jgi:hypothetical protein